MISSDVGNWLTSSRVERLPLVIRAVRSHPPPGISEEQASRLLWPVCGGPRDEVEDLLTVLIRAGLVIRRNDRLRLSKEGTRIATQDHQSGGTLLARALIDAGFFSLQSRRLGELWESVEDSSGFICQRKIAIATAPQLVGLLRRFSGVAMTNVLMVPASVAGILADVWVLPNQGDDSRKAVGARGEYYSYRYEQMRAPDARKIRWVAQDDDSLGYDIEDQNVVPRRRIEVKASRGVDIRFILSSNEWKVAHDNPLAYEIHYWGRVNTSRPMRDEFNSLTTAGYPVIFQNLPGLIATGDLTAEPVGYAISGSLSG